MGRAMQCGQPLRSCLGASRNTLVVSLGEPPCGSGCRWMPFNRHASDLALVLPVVMVRVTAQ